MTREDIIRMANEANLPACHLTHPKALERFANLVAEHEREACAKLREMLHPFDLHNRSEMLGVMNQSLDDYQNLIRARGNVATNDTTQERVDETAKQRHWVELTDEEIKAIAKPHDDIEIPMTGRMWVFVADLMDKLKEKNT